MDKFSPIWVYILQCSDGTFYTGVTRDLNKRIHQHNHSRGALYTKLRKPVKLVYSEKHMSHAEAYRRERAIKRFSHDWKSGIVQAYELPDKLEFIGTGKAP